MRWDARGEASLACRAGSTAASLTVTGIGSPASGGDRSSGGGADRSPPAGVTDPPAAARTDPRQRG